MSLINVSNERVYGYMRPQTPVAERHITWWNHVEDPYSRANYFAKFEANRAKEVASVKTSETIQQRKDDEALQQVRQELLSLIDSRTCIETTSPLMVVEYDGLVPSGD